MCLSPLRLNEIQVPFHIVAVACLPLLVLTLATRVRVARRPRVFLLVSPPRFPPRYTGVLLRRAATVVREGEEGTADNKQYHGTDKEVENIG